MQRVYSWTILLNCYLGQKGSGIPARLVREDRLPRRILRDPAGKTRAVTESMILAWPGTRHPKNK